MGIFRVHESNNEVTYITKGGGIKERVYGVGKKALNCLVRNKYALALSLWSYVLIEASVFGLDQISTEGEYNLAKCRQVVCSIWKNSTEQRNLFSNTSNALELRCDSSHPNYHAFYFFEECMNYLCDYVKNAGINLKACLDFNPYAVTEASREELHLTSELWNRLCPKKHFRHKNLISEATYINSCIISSCNYFDTFEVKLEPGLSELCENMNAPKLNELLAKLSKIIHHAEKKMEEDDGWSRANTVSAIIASVSTIAVSVIATVTTIFTYQMTKTHTLSSNIPSIIAALRGIANGALETTRALTNSQNLAGAMGSADIILNDFLVEVQHLITEVTETLEHSFSYHEHNRIGNNLGNIREVGKIGIQSLAPPAIVPLVSTGVEGILVKVVNGVAVVSQLSKSNKADNPILESSTDSPLKSKVSIDRLKTFIQQFVNDLTFPSSKEGRDIATTQANRLKESLERWQNAYCHYIEQLFCRLPLPIHKDQDIIFIPDDHIHSWITKKLSGLCYVFLDNLWCNWTMFLETLTDTNNTIHSNNTYCPWDHVVLKLKQDIQDAHQYQIEALGSCYNQTLLLKV